MSIAHNFEAESVSGDCRLALSPADTSVAVRWRLLTYMSTNEPDLVLLSTRGRKSKSLRRGGQVVQRSEMPTSKHQLPSKHQATVIDASRFHLYEAKRRNLKAGPSGRRNPWLRFPAPRGFGVLVLCGSIPRRCSSVFIGGYIRIRNRWNRHNRWTRLRVCANWRRFSLP